MAYKKKNNRPARQGEGRPQKALPDNWQSIILEMASKGCSDVEIRAKLCMQTEAFSHSTWDALEARNEEFSATLKKARVLCEAWWHEQARENLEHSKNRVFETALWFINMKNRFGWKDKTDVDHNLPDETYEKLKTLSVAELNKKFKELLPGS